MTWVIVAACGVAVVALATTYLVGLWQGSRRQQDELLRVRMEAIEARRATRRMVRDAFVRIAEQASGERRIR